MGGGEALSARELRRPAAPLRAVDAPFRKARRSLLGWFGLFAGLVLAGGASAVPGLDPGVPIEFSADRLDYVDAGEIYIADGNVTIRQAGRTLTADWMAISLATRRGVASGRVQISDADQVATASFMEFDVDTLRGILFDAEIDTGADGFVVAGRELERRSDVDYAVRDGGFTSCRCPEEDDREPWRVETDAGEVELGGYGHARNSTVEVLGVPVAWLPWILFPVKTERESGVLLPDLAFGGTNGVQVGLPLFWAARHDVGVIFTPQYLQNAGFKGDLEVEYVIGEQSSGVMAGAYVRDDRGGGGTTGVPENRWAVLVEHDQYLPADFRARVDAKAISDNAYLDDFDDYAVYRRNLFLNSSAFAFGQFGDSGRLGVVGSLMYADDLQNPLGLDRDATLLNRLPDVGVRVLPGEAPFARVLGLAPSLDSDLIYFFQREDPRVADPTAIVGPGGRFLDAGIDPAAGAADPTRGDGIFEPGEPLMEDGTRFTLRPRIARPVSLGGVADFVPELGYAETLYDGNRTGFAERGVASARGDLRTRLVARRNLGVEHEGEHSLMPFVRYTWIRTRNQDAVPVFTPPSTVAQERLRQLDPENYVLDPSDRIPDANVLAAGFDNEFRIGRRAGGADPLRADAWISFQHDFDQGDAGQLVLGGQSDWRGRLAGAASLSLDAGEGQIDEALLGLRFLLPDWASLRSPYLSGRYRYLRVPPQITNVAQREIDQIDLGLGFRISERFAIDYSIAYSLEDGARLAQVGSVVYASRCKCFSIGFDVVEDRTRDVFFRVRYSITGLGNAGADPFAAARGLFSDTGF